jgi:peptidyl-prolyl cis-trans isomerase D
VPAFERAAFSLKVGEVSGLVRSQYGFHIIKVTDRREPMTRPLDSVRQEIVSTLKQEKASEMMEEAVQAAAAFLRRTNSLEAFAEERQRLKVQETPFFGRQDTLAQLGGSREIRRMAFELPIGEISPPVRLGNGYAFFKVLEERPPHVPDLEEVKTRVQEDLRREKAMAKALEQATALKAKLEKARNPQSVIEAEGLELKQTETFYRGTQLPEVGRSPAVQEAAFSNEPGSGFSIPLPGNAGYVLLRVLSRSGYSEAEYAAKRDEFIETLLQEKRQALWSAYLQELQDRYSVQIDRDTLRKLTS